MFSKREALRFSLAQFLFSLTRRERDDASDMWGTSPHELSQKLAESPLPRVLGTFGSERSPENALIDKYPSIRR